MHVVETIAALRLARKSLAGRVGLVPTMGYLHDGHLALMRQAARENDYVVVSIFVNPAQFGPDEDFSGYPRNRERDLQMLRGANVDLVFIPAADEMYPPGFQTCVEVTGVSQGLEGGRRPGHFRGVATVVAKLFHLVQPDRAYFGQKDAQQVAVIRRMVDDLAFPLKVVTVPTQRAADGLALSSRNVYLSADQRAAAPVLYHALIAAREVFEQGSRDGPALRDAMKKTLEREPLASIDYVSAADLDSLTELDGASGRPILISLAVRFGTTRLIDNMILLPE